MKYIKKFEEKMNKFYWLIPTDERRKDALDKIGCTNHTLYTMEVDDKYFFIGNNNGNWGWTRYNGDIYDSDEKWLIDNGYKYMGTIDINDYELDQAKFNL